MAFDPRDELWNATYDTLYFTYYNEILCDTLVRRWQITDDLTKVLVALTASGSAISGWALWSDQRFQFLWVGIAGFAALLSIVHSALGVPSRLKDWGDSKRRFASLRIELETFQYRMRVNPEFSTEEFMKELVE